MATDDASVASPAFTPGEVRRIVEPAPAKLNLWLRVLGRRPDGLHELDSLAEPLAWGDRVEVSLASRKGHGSKDAPEVLCRCPDFPELDGPANLAYRAAQRALTCLDAPLRCELTVHKAIPLGAGLGGGSADAAATLRALFRLLGPVLLSKATVEALAESVGADVPFCLRSETARIRGWGERLTPERLPPHWLCLVYPRVSMSTKTAFARLAPPHQRRCEREDLPSHYPASVRATLDALAPEIGNDLLPQALESDKRVHSAYAALGKQGGLALGMTGSGSCLFSLHQERAAAQAAARALALEGMTAWTAAPLPQGSRLWPPEDRCTLNVPVECRPASVVEEAECSGEDPRR